MGNGKRKEHRRHFKDTEVAATSETPTQGFAKACRSSCDLLKLALALPLFVNVQIETQPDEMTHARFMKQDS